MVIKTTFFESVTAACKASKADESFHVVAETPLTNSLCASQAVIQQYQHESVHCPKNHPNLCTKTEPVHWMAWMQCMVYICAVFVPDKCAQKPDKYRCIRFIRDMLGFFCRVFRFFGTVCSMCTFYCAVAFQA